MGEAGTQQKSSGHAYQGGWVGLGLWGIERGTSKATRWGGQEATCNIHTVRIVLLAREATWLASLGGGNEFVSRISPKALKPRSWFCCLDEAVAYLDNS